jgi:hypothetical protein
MKIVEKKKRKKKNVWEEQISGSKTVTSSNITAGNEPPPAEFLCSAFAYIYESYLITTRRPTSVGPGRSSTDTRKKS